MPTRPLVCFALCAALFGCSSPNPVGTDAFVAQDAFVARDAFVPTDGGLLSMDAGHDAFVGTDANVDAGHDAFVAVDANIDAGHDAFVAVDANVDAGRDAFVPPDTNSCAPHTFVVTVTGSSYTIDGAMNPTLTLCRGVTYMFNLTGASTAGHPLGLYATTPAAGFPTPGTPLMMFSAGATTSYTIPTTAPFPVAYRCTVHNFGGAVVVP